MAKALTIWLVLLAGLGFAQPNAGRVKVKSIQLDSNHEFSHVLDSTTFECLYIEPESYDHFNIKFEENYGGSDFSVEIQIDTFNVSRHDTSGFDKGKIDGVHYYGSDGGLPSWEFTQFSVNMNGSEVPIDFSLIQNLYNSVPSYENVAYIECYYLPEQDWIMISSYGGDGGGAYGYLLIISEQGIIGRYIDNLFEDYQANGPNVLSSKLKVEKQWNTRFYFQYHFVNLALRRDIRKGDHHYRENLDSVKNFDLSKLFTLISDSTYGNWGILGEDSFCYQITNVSRLSDQLYKLVVHTNEGARFTLDLHLKDAVAYSSKSYVEIRTQFIYAEIVGDFRFAGETYKVSAFCEFYYYSSYSNPTLKVAKMQGYAMQNEDYMSFALKHPSHTLSAYHCGKYWWK